MNIYDAFLYGQMAGTVPLASGVFKALLVKSGTTCGSQNATINTIADFTTLGELTGTGYARADVQNITVTRDSTNHRAEFSFDPVEFPALDVNNGTITGILLYHVASNIPVFFEPMSVVTTGTKVVVTPNATTGAMYSKQGP